MMPLLRSLRDSARTFLFGKGEIERLADDALKSFFLQPLMVPSALCTPVLG